MSDCCDTTCETDIKKSALCQTCGEEGKKVDDLAVKSLLKEGKLYDFIPNTQYFYCKTMGCNIVYFTDNGESAFTINNIKTKIALKNENKEGYVCFCFAHTVKDIEEEVKVKGESHISKSIAKECKLKKDACEVKNPSGKCCLGEVKKVINDTLAQLAKPITALSS